MNKKWKIFGIQTNFEWYDVKTTFKQLLRKITYTWLFQELICLLIISYLKLVYLTSKKKFVNHEALLALAKNGLPSIMSFWHNRLAMTPFASLAPKKQYPNYQFMALASKHGDGRFVGKVMEKFGMISILGSTNDRRKPSRGISFSSLKQIIDGLKKGYSLCITPDGPRGPNQKINGEVVNLARISGAGILAGSCSYSRFIELNTWDKFKIPLPFSTICFYFDEKPLYIAKDAKREEVEKFKIMIEERMNLIQEKSFGEVKGNSK